MADVEVLHCSVCDIAFSLPVRFVERRRGDGQNFFCPVGHAQVFRAPRDRDKELAAMTTERDAWKKEAQRLLEECDKLRAGLPVRVWWKR